MTSGKLTTYLKQEIVTNILRDTFDKREEGALNLKKSVGDSVYFKMYPKVLCDWIELTPEGALAHNDTIKTYVNRCVYSIPMSKSRKFYYRDLTGEFNLSSYPDIEKQFLYVLNLYDELSTERKSLRREINGLLSCVTTVKRLTELWPSVAKFIPSATVTNLPMVNTDKLDTLICSLKEKGK